MRVLGVFNPAAVRVGDEIVLLLRVAEAPRDVGEDEVAAPILDVERGDIVVERFRKDDPAVDATDPREIKAHGKTVLTSISHLRVARSRDGERFEVEPMPALAPAGPLETYGIEDPRITRIDDRYVINYSAVSPNGICTALASTRDFRSFERLGVAFPPNNRNVTIFPEKIGGRHVALHRPMPEGIGVTQIWIARSEDLRSWGDHRPLAGPRPGAWDDLKVGGGAVPFRVRAKGADGWLAIYHGVCSQPFGYALGALLLAADDPSVVLARSSEPVLAAEEPYEKSGFLGNVVFTCGLVVDREPASEADRVRIYYGAADGVTAMASAEVGEILARLR